MAATARATNKPRKESNNPSMNVNQRRGAWRGGPPSFPSHASQANSRNSTPSPSSHAPSSSVSNPPLGPLQQSLEGRVDTAIIAVLRNGSRFEGVLTTVNHEGIILKNCKDLSTNGPIKESHFIPGPMLSNWLVADVQPSTAVAPASTNGTEAPTKAFRTDTDISASARPSIRERELQAWQPDPSHPFSEPGPVDDNTTFGPSAGGGTWDQFAANQQLFGVTTGFDEELYTTKLDRSRPGFKEQERRAAQLAQEIQNSTSSNPHVAEERGIVDDSGANEEDKYGAVVRKPGSYVPPGARGGGPVSTTGVPALARTDSNRSGTASNPTAPSVSAQSAVATPSAPSATSELPKVAVNLPDAGSKPNAGDNLVGTFRDFVTNEKQRLTQKKQQLVKKDKDSRIADLLKFSQEFKLNRPIPADLVPILAKDEKKQQAIIDKSTAEASSTNARAIGPHSTMLTAPPPSQHHAVVGAQHRTPLGSTPSVGKAGAATRPPVLPPSASVAAASTAGAKAAGAARPLAPTAASTVATPAKPSTPSRPAMVIQKIPPFRKKLSPEAIANGTTTPPDGSPASPTGSNSFKFNAKASSFRPNPNASAFKPTGSTPPAASSSKAKPESPPVPQPANPFFGTRPIKKTPAYIKEDFNPFKYAKVAEPSAISPNWPYNGKRYIQMFPPPAAPPAQPVLGPAPSFEEDPAHAAARNYALMYTYAPYPYPGQHPQQQQQMMAVPGAPPAGYMPSPFMQPMPYPPPPHQPGGHPAMYGPPPMNGLPPQGYLPPPPPGAYAPPPNAPRGSVPPTPIPQHAYLFHQQSPQLAHAVPYPMFPPGGAPPPHPYDGSASGPPGPGPMAAGH